MAIELIREAVTNGARLILACIELGICRRTFDRWRAQIRQLGRTIDGRTQQRNPQIAQMRRLSPEERQEALRVCNSERFASMPPSQIVPILAQEGQYICSEATLYRILKEYGQNQRRDKARRLSRPVKPKPVKATAPQQCFSWDITYLPSIVAGMYFKLYLIMDVFSRKIVGWEVHDRECGELAAQLLYKTKLREGLSPNAMTLHSDNGAPMKSQSMIAMMERLGVTGSFSRPSVSNDNPFSESLFKTLKYVPMYPNKPFVSLEHARQWVLSFVTWYNTEHHHSGIKFVTPNEKHAGKDVEILQKRTETFGEARDRNPLRWSREIRNWSPVLEVILNPETAVEEEKKAA